jgi:hypothetical protein
MSATPYGLAATFETPADLMAAAEKVRDAGYSNWDCITPFPVHGLDAAMGLGRSHVPKFTFVMGATGFTLGLLMVWFMNKYDYPLIVGGKPYFSPIFPFPVAYELTILLGAFGTIGGMFLLNRLPMHYHPVLKTNKIIRALDDQFLIVIETRDPKFDAKGTRDLLAKLGGRDIEELES